MPSTESKGSAGAIKYGYCVVANRIVTKKRHKCHPEHKIVKMWLFPEGWVLMKEGRFERLNN